MKTLESAVQITILCPQCSTKYSLRLERVAQSIKRALCYRCQAEFNIEGAVLELLGMAHEGAEPASSEPASDFAGTGSAALHQAAPAGQALDAAAAENADIGQVLQVSGTEEAIENGEQLPTLDVQGPTVGSPDLKADFPPASEPDSPAAAAIGETSLPPIHGTLGAAPPDAGLAMGDIGVEIESSDLIFALGETLSAKGDETRVLSDVVADADSGAYGTNAFDTVPMKEGGAEAADPAGRPTIPLEPISADGQSDIIAVPLEDAKEPTASGDGSDEKSNLPIQIGFEPTDENASDELSITIEYPDEFSEASFLALGEDATETPDPQKAAQASPFSEDVAGPPALASAFGELGAEKMAETKGLDFNVSDLPDATMPITAEPIDDAEVADAVPVPISLGKAEDGAAPEALNVPQAAQQQGQSILGAAPSASDVSVSEPAELSPAAQPKITPSAGLAVEDTPAPTGPQPDQVLDGAENALADKAQLSAAGQAEKMPKAEAQKPPGEPAPQAANATAKIKIKMGENLLENLTIEEAAAMVEDGRLLENHYVAHQFSENWIAAPQAPALRPIFEKLRTTQRVKFKAPPPPTIQSGKRGLFNGLFGRN